MSTFYRVGWRDLETGEVGYGDWQENRRELKRWIDRRNKQSFGRVNYWLESSHTSRIDQDLKVRRRT